MSNTILFCAAAGFEAARQLNGPGEGLQGARLHGHSFRAEVRAALSAGWGGFVGGEAEALQQRLQEVVAPLDYAHLNNVIANPTDGALAQWIEGALSMRELQRVHLWSGPAAGATWTVGQSMQAWRRYRFESAHRLPHVSAGHQCGRMHGHGFEVMFSVDAGAGDALHRAWSPVHHQLHLACLNDIKGLENPTSEMLCQWIWQRLISDVPSLTAVTVFETASCGSVFDGQRYRIWKDLSFDSATRLQQAPDAARRGVHGHTYTLRVGLSAPLHAVMGWTVDYGDVKTLFSPVFTQLDHHPLHEGASAGDMVSLLHWIHAQVATRLPALDSLELFDTPGTGALISGLILGSDPEKPKSGSDPKTRK